MVRRLFLLTMVVGAVLTGRADYPIFWQRYTADPWCIEHNGRLYMYCSHDFYDAARGYAYLMHDITCISTTDLKNWTDHGEVFSAADCAWGATKTWAPCIVERDGRFYLYYGNGDQGIGVAVSDSPTGPFKDNLKKPMVDFNTPGVRQPGLPRANVEGTLGGSENWGFWCFDPTVFVDDDGQAYMYFGGAHPDNSRIIRVKRNMMEVEGEAIHPNTPGFFEASQMHKYQGHYYYSYSGHALQIPSNIDYVMSNSPMGNFDSKVRCVLPNPPVNELNNNHHCIFEYRGEWYIAYHNRQVAYEHGETDAEGRIYQRSVCLDRLYYNPDGTMREVQITRDGLPQLHWVNPYERCEAETMAKGWGIATEPVLGKNRATSFTHNGDYIKIRGVDISRGIHELNVRAQGNGTLELHLESEHGLLLSSLSVKTDNWQTLSAPATSVLNGIYDVYLVFHGIDGQQLYLDYWSLTAL